MSRQFKVGDVVHIKSEGHMQLQYGMHRHSSADKQLSPIRGTKEPFCGWDWSMFEYCGKEVIICRKVDWRSSYIYEVKLDGYNTGWSWSPQSFEEYDMEE